VLVWLTSYQTPLFFAQAVGRVLRARTRRETATVFLPAVRPLLALAADMEVQRDHVLAPAKQSDGLDQEWERVEPGETETLEKLGSEARFGHVLYGGRAVMGDIDVSDDDQEFLGLPGLLSASQTARLLAQREKRRVSGVRGAVTVVEAPKRSATEEVADLRSEIVSLVRQFSHRYDEPIPKTHVLVRNSVPGPKNAEASLEVLRARRDWLLERTV